MRWKFAIAALFLLLFLSGGWAADNGSALYKKRCAGCHGANGQGKPAAKAPALKGTPIEVDQLTKQILNGESTSKGVHKKGFSRINDEQASAIAQYVKSLR